MTQSGDPPESSPEGQDGRSDDDLVPKTICGAKRTDGGICVGRPMKNGRCYHHGGASLSGPRNPNWKGGRYSRHDKLAEKMEAAGVELQERIDDPNLLDPRRPLASIEECLAQHWAGVKENDTPEWRKRCLGEFDEAMVQLRESPATGLASLRRVRNLLERGARKGQAMSHVEATAETLARLQTGWWRNALTARESVSQAEFVGFIWRLADLIEEEVGKDHAGRIVAAADERLLGGVLGLSRKGS